MSRRAGKGLFLTGGAPVEGQGFLELLAAHGSMLSVGLALGVVEVRVGSVAASFGLI